MYSDEHASYLISASSKIIKLYYQIHNEDEKFETEKSEILGKLIKELCDFFDNIKDFSLNQSQLKFLYKMSNIVGIPQYFDMLCKYKNNEIAIHDIDLYTFMNTLFNCTLYISDETALHLYQKQVIDKFIAEKQNRYFLTAPTSFGKTFIVAEIIKKMHYNNIVLIFPTLSLLSENYANILKNEAFSEYKIHTLSNFTLEESVKNIWIYTPERFMTMTDKFNNLNFDFVFMDEVYKIDNTFLLDSETIGENERDISYRIALNLTCKKSRDFLLAGPYINVPDMSFESSINNFFNDNGVKYLNYNNIEIVDKEILTIKQNNVYNIDKITIPITNQDKNKRLVKVIKELNIDNSNSIIYVNARYIAETTARQIAKNRDYLTPKSIKLLANVSDENQNDFMRFVTHLANQFSIEWVIVDCLRKRVGIHHGYVPKYVQKEIIRFFNLGILDCIVSTTTITEGVNTSAKNMIVMSDKKGDKPLKKFDAQNIAGRAGRFIYHYKGRVVSIDNDFQNILEEEGGYLNHADYDKGKDKNEIDILISEDKYLTSNDKKTKHELLTEAKSLGINNDIIEQFKSVPLKDKIVLFKSLRNISDVELLTIKNLIQEQYMNKLNWDGFETVLRFIYPIINNDSLKRLIDCKTGPLQKYCALTVKVHSYITEGFKGIYQYELQNKSNADAAIRKTAELSFNLFRYHLVKYLGIFDLIYRYQRAETLNKLPDDIYGISIILQLLEYGAKSPEGKIISDYGVPFNVLHYIDSQHSFSIDNLDKYELEKLSDIKKLFDIE